MTPRQLAEAAAYLIEHEPRCTLEKNQVGNLSVMVDGQYAGFLDLKTGQVELFRLGQD